MEIFGRLLQEDGPGIPRRKPISTGILHGFLSLAKSPSVAASGVYRDSWPKTAFLDDGTGQPLSLQSNNHVRSWDETRLARRHCLKI